MLVSETMLAQTQVRRAAERYPEFIARYPTPLSMATDVLGEVLRLWQGLGYPRRAANLWQCADRLVSQHGGAVPRDLATLLALPGVGPYTARAVLAFAFDDPAMPVDTNTGRVLARCTGRRLTDRDAQALGDSFVTHGRPREVALSFMDLGATLCRPIGPSCDECPLQPGCSFGQSRARCPAAPGEDPAVGSARVSRRQARFQGSDRQGRGRLLRRAAEGGIAAEGVAEAAGWPDDPVRAERIAASLVAEGLLRVADGCYELPY